MVCKEKPTLKYCHWYPANFIIFSINFIFLIHLNYVPTLIAHRPVTLCFYQASWSIPRETIPALTLGSSDFFFLHMIHPIPHHPLPSNLHLLKVPLRSSLYETLPKSPVYTDIPFIQVPVTKHPIVSPRRIL